MSTSFDDAAASLLAVIGDHVDSTVALGPPRASVSEAAVDVQLIGFEHGSRERHRGLHRLPVQLDFLVAVTGPGDAVPGLLHDVIAALEASGEHELSRASVPLDWWVAFGVAPRPALRVSTPVHVDRSIERGPIVTDLPIVKPEILRPTVGAATERKA